MTMTDPIADMLTRLRNANQAYHDSVTMPYSKLKQGVAEILKAEGYITSFDVAEAPDGGVDAAGSGGGSMRLAALLVQATRPAAWPRR